MSALGAGLTRVRILNLRELASHRLRVVTSLIVVIVSSALLIAVLGAYGSMTETVRQFNAAISGSATVEVAAIADSGIEDQLVGELRREVSDAKAVVPLVRLAFPHHGASVSRCTTASPRLWRSRHQGAAKAPRQHGGMYCSHGKYPFMNYCDLRDRC